MRKKKKNEMAVGITVLLVLVLTVYIVVILADWSSLLTTQQEITVRLPYKVGLKGLSQGSPVYLGGVKIGYISDTGISTFGSSGQGNDEIYVFFKMDIPQQYQLRNDCRLVPQSNVLGGQVLLSIEDLGQEGEIIADGQTADLMLADTMMEAMKHEFDPTNPDSLMARVKYEFNMDNKDSIIAYFKNTISQLEKDLPVISMMIQKELNKIDETLEVAQATLNEFKKFTKDERIEKLLDNTVEVSTNLKLTSQEVRRAPWKLLYKPSKKEFRIQALIDSAGAFASGAETLDTTALRLQKLINEMNESPEIDRDRVNSMLIELESSFDEFKKAEKKFWDELN